MYLLNIFYNRGKKLIKTYPSLQVKNAAGILTLRLVSSSIISIRISLFLSLSMIITAIAPEFSEFNDLVVKEHFLIKKKYFKTNDLLKI
jgi:hypothetical protein